MCWFYLDEVVQDSFAGHVTVDSVVSVQEVRSEMMQQRVQVQGVVTALLTAVDTLTALKHTETSEDEFLKICVTALVQNEKLN